MENLQGKEQPANRAFFIFFFCFFCFVLLPGVSSFFSLESIHWKVSVLHRTGVVDQSDLTGPHLTGSGVIYCHPVDAQNTFTSNCSWLTELKSTSCLLSSPVLVPPVTIAAFRRARKGFWPLISFCPGIISLSQNTIKKLMLRSIFFFLMFYVVKSLLF